MRQRISQEYLESYLSLSKAATKLMNLNRVKSADSSEYQEAIRERDAAREHLIEIVKKEDEEMVDQAIEKLQRELEELKTNKSFGQAIYANLRERCSSDIDFANRVSLEGKTLDKCLNYVINFARKQKDGNCVALPDDVVYDKAAEYYTTQDADIKQDDVSDNGGVRTQAPEQKVESAPEPAPSLSKQEKRKAKQKAQSSDDGQLSLFDLGSMGG